MIATQTPTRVYIHTAVRIAVVLLAIGSIVGAFLFRSQKQTPSANRTVPIATGGEVVNAQPTSLFASNRVLVKFKVGVSNPEQTINNALRKPLPTQVEKDTGFIVQRNQDAVAAPEDIEVRSLPVTLRSLRSLAPSSARRATPTQDPAGASRWQRLELTTDADISALVDRLQALPEIEKVEPDFYLTFSYVPNDFYYNTDTATPPVYSWNQRDVTNAPYPDLWGLKRIGAATAWDTTLGNASTIVAVVDSGVDVTHPDLANNIWNNVGEVGQDAQARDKKSNGVDDDGNGYIDDWQGWNFSANSNVVSDEHGHGTHVSGIIAAQGNNAIGVSGVCPQCKVMPVRIADSTGALSGDATFAIMYAADMGAKVINNSWGAAARSQSIQDAITYAFQKNVLVVFAAGNNGKDTRYFYPEGPEILTVAAWSPSNAVADFSNYGSRVDLIAPGDGILSLRATNTNMYGGTSHIVGNQYLYASGTSMAAPFASGVAGLVAAAHPDFTGEEIRQALRKGSEDIGPVGWDPQTGHGLLRADVALQQSASCMAKLLTPGNFANIAQATNPLVITGIASCDNFSSYTIEVGSGETPSSWQQVSESSTAVSVTGTLASINPQTVFTQRGTYTLRLRVVTSGGVTYEDRQIVMRSLLKATNFPKNGASFMGQASPMVVDVLQVGAKNIVGGGRAYRGDGTSLPGWPVMKSIATSAYGDVLPDSPGLEYVSYSSTLDLYLSNGTLAPGSWPKEFSNVLDGNIVVADLNRDGADEVIVSSGSSVFAWRGDGSLLPGFPVNGYTAYELLVGDIDGDPQLEIVMNNGTKVQIIHHDGTTILSNLSTKVSPYGDTLCLMDVTGDGKLDVLNTSGNGPYFSFPQTYGNFFQAVVPDPTYSFPLFNPIVRPAAIDVLGDAKTELFFAKGDYLYGYAHDGTPLPGFPYITYALLNTQPIAADADNDGDQDLVFASFAGWVHAIDTQGRDLPGFPFRIIKDNEAYFNTLWSSVAVGDVTGDSQFEIVVLETGMTYDKFHVYQLGGTSSRWPMFMYSPGHTQAEDVDDDTVLDGWERAFNLSTSGSVGLNVDSDGDTLNALQEFEYGGRPDRADTDGDGLQDGDEVAQASQVWNPDSPVDTTPPKITNVWSHDTTKFGFTIEVRTSEQTTTRVEYGPTTAYGSTIQDAILKTTISLPLTDLTHSTTYHYRVHVTDAGGNTTSSADYSYTTSGCTESWSCSTWSSCVNNQQARTCTDRNACGTTVTRPPLLQACTPPTCTEQWSCTAWSSCVNNQQSRTCTDARACGTTTNRPAITQSCTTPACTEQWSCSSWSSCVNNQQTRNCIDARNCGTVATRPALTQVCTSVCTPSWSCSAWTDCVNSSQRRTCIDANVCGSTSNKPIETQVCAATSCVPNWTCTSWSACVNSKQSRSCTDANRCGVTITKPVEILGCSQPQTVTTSPRITISTLSQRVFVQPKTKQDTVRVTVQGTNFRSGMYMLVGSRNVGYELRSSTEATITLPVGMLAAGKHHLLVGMNKGDNVTMQNAFTVRGATPSIRAISPTQVTATSSRNKTDRIVITGSNFSTRARVFVGGIEAVRVKFVTRNRLEVYITPARYRRGQTYPVVVRHLDDQQATAKTRIRIR